MLNRRVDVGLLVAGSEHVGNNLLSGEGCEGERPDEFLSGVGHDDLYADAPILQHAHNFSRLVRRNPAADAEGNFHRNC